MASVTAQNLSKKFKLYPRPSHRLLEWFSPTGKLYHKDFWALRDITFSLEPGSSLGIIGPNGAGKSTLLKILTGTTSPTAGSYAIPGRVSSLLELGAGFHPEFTGRQNLQMNARMLGLSNEEILERMGEIVDFAELGPFVDQPVRTYSSGMYVRLGFAIAASVNPNVLIIDEALSVGDAYFQRKSLDRILHFKEIGTTILFVSHDLSIVRRFCDMALWLNEGQVQSFGDAHKVVKAYEMWERKKEEVKLGVEYSVPEEEKDDLVTDGSGSPSRDRKKKMKVLGSTWGSGEVKITQVEMLDADGKAKWTFNTAERVTIRYHYYAFQDIPNPIFGMNIHRLDGVYVFGTNNYNIHPSDIPDLRKGPGVVDFQVDSLLLHSGVYFITANVYLKPDEPFWSEPADFHYQKYEFKVWSGHPQHGIIPLHGKWNLAVAGAESTAAKQSMDLEADEDFSFGSGWRNIEQSPVDGDELTYKYAWAGPKASFVVRILQDAESLVLDLNGNALEKPEGQTLRFSIEGQSIGELVVLKTGFLEHSISVPEEFRGRTVEVRFETDQVFVPKDLWGTDDSRELSVAVRGIWTR